MLVCFSGYLSRFRETLPVEQDRKENKMRKLNKGIVAFALAVVMVMSLAACGGDTKKTESEPTSKETKVAEQTAEGQAKTAEAKNFPKFTGKDFAGNKVDSSMFKNNKLTMLTFWFTGCQACVAEMPYLEKLSQDMKDKSVGVVGVCTDISSMGATLEEAQKILDDSGVKYTNITIDSSPESDEFLMNIFAYPTSILVDSEGNIVGDPITGAISNDNQLSELENKISELVDGMA